MISPIIGGGISLNEPTGNALLGLLSTSSSNTYHIAGSNLQSLRKFSSRSALRLTISIDSFTNSGVRETAGNELRAYSFAAVELGNYEPLELVSTPQALNYRRMVVSERDPPALSCILLTKGSSGSSFFCSSYELPSFALTFSITTITSSSS